MYFIIRLLGWLVRRFGRKLNIAEAKRRALIARGRRDPSAVKPSPNVVSTASRAPHAVQLPENPSLLILQFAHIGDFVLSLRALRKLREGFPASRITLAAASWNVEWAEKTGYFERVIAFDFFPPLNRDWRGVRPELYDRFAALDVGAHDIAIDLRHDADTRPCLYRVDAKIRAGFAAPAEIGRPFLDLLLPQVESLPLSNGGEYSLHAETRLEMLADAVVSAFAPPSRPHPIALLAGAAAPDPTRRPYAVLALSAGDPIRRWSLDRFAEVARGLIDARAFDIVLVGGAEERAAVASVAAGLPAERVASAVDLPLIALASLVARSSLVVGLGTGVSHLAATLGVPLVAVLSGVSPLSVWRPVGPRVVTLTGEMPCAPCGFKDERQCPFGVACLNAVTAEHVLAAVDQVSPASAMAPVALAEPGR